MLLETTVPLKLTHFLSAVFQVCSASQAHFFIKACSFFFLFFLKCSLLTC